ncbi:hypothetical protein LCGC14_1721050 [marine sediment metagenome]|uniref:Uncharacterized protein n=1 Tax=marine sediment metagenome TaxID=412755 RepID=A0A0F9HC55_9ZZZZ
MQQSRNVVVLDILPASAHRYIDCFTQVYTRLKETCTYNSYSSIDSTLHCIERLGGV